MGEEEVGRQQEEGGVMDLWGGGDLSGRVNEKR